jgi:hypothetical protein
VYLVNAQLLRFYSMTIANSPANASYFNFIFALFRKKQASNALGATTFSVTTLTIMTFVIKTIRQKSLFVTLSRVPSC